MMKAATCMLSAFLAVLGVGGALAQATADADLIGLWEARRQFGPEVRGQLVLIPREGGLVADIAGFAVPVVSSGDTIRFELPDRKGTFRAGRATPGQDIAGFWIQPRTAISGLTHATPVTLRWAAGRWRGEVRPLEQAFSFYLPVSRAEDGRLDLEGVAIGVARLRNRRCDLRLGGL